MYILIQESGQGRSDYKGKSHSRQENTPVQHSELQVDAVWKQILNDEQEARFSEMQGNPRSQVRKILCLIKKQNQKKKKRRKNHQKCDRTVYTTVISIALQANQQKSDTTHNMFLSFYFFCKTLKIPVLLNFYISHFLLSNFKFRVSASFLRSRNNRHHKAEK